MTPTSFLQAFTKFILRFRWPVLLLILIISIILAGYTRRLEVNNDYDSWLPANDKVSEDVRKLDRLFASNALIFVVLDFQERGVFHPESLDLVKRLTSELEGLEELYNVNSLTNMVDIRKTDYGIEVGDLILEVPESEEEMKALEHYVLSKEMYVGSLISSDARYTTLVTYINPEYDEIMTSQVILDTVQEAAGETRYYFGGDPAMTFFMTKYMEQDLKSLVPVILLVMILVLTIGLRSFMGVAISICLVGLCLLWAMGLQGIFNFPINILTTPLAVMLIALGSDYAVHIYNHFQKRKDVKVSTAEIALPVILSAVTTIAGLLTFSMTKIDLLKYFGFELGFGLGSACLLSVVLLPICIYIFRARPSKKADPEAVESTNHFISRWLISLGTLVSRNSKVVLAFALLGLIVMGFGITRITTNIDFITMLPEESPPRQGANILQEHFSGMYPATVFFQEDVEDPAKMKIGKKIENFMHSSQSLSNFSSINSLIAEENWLMNGIYAIPDTREGVANLWLLLEGADSLKTFVTTDRQNTIITGMINEASTDILTQTADFIRTFFSNRDTDELVEIDPSRLSPEGQEVLLSLMIEDAASQVSWLAQGYDKSREFAPDYFKAGIESGCRKALEGTGINLDSVWKAAGIYLEEETVEVLPPDLIELLLAELKNNWTARNRPEIRKQMENLIIANGVMDAEDAEMTVAGVLKRCKFEFRLQQVATVASSYQDILTSPLKQNKNFRKRSEGVLWELFTDRAVFFTPQVASIHEIDNAVLKTIRLNVEPAGLQEVFRRFNELLFQSQIQSLLMASLVVFILVSLTQFSIKRGFISLMAVLVPLEFIMGMMGYLGIPLEMGTVLCAALIIGLGVDGSIHFLHYYHNLDLKGIRGEAAIRATMGHVGKAIITANATTCCGFIVLLFSKTGAVINFGLINSMAIFMVTISIITFLPALVTLLHVDENNNDKPS